MTDPARIEELESGCGRHSGVRIGTICGECQLERAEAAESALTALREEREQKDHEDDLTRTGEPVTLPPERATAPTDTDYPIVTCPLCDADHQDLDGFGFVACDVCGYCTHPSLTGDVCGICGRRVEPPSADARLTDSEKGKASGSATESDLRDLRTQIAHLTEERNQLRAAYKRLVADASPRIAALTEEHVGLRTENQKLLRIINRVLDHFIYQPQSRLYSVTEVAWLNQPYMFKTPGEWLRAELDALLSPREGTPLEDQDSGLPGSAATKGL